MAVEHGPFLGLVQFPHPGPEHNARPFLADGVFPWNSGDHRRKFLETDGSWQNELGAEQSGRLRFWGEFEAPTRVRALGHKQGRLPRWVHEPQYPPVVQGRRQNTDPLVLGGFHYSNCKQHRLSGQHSPSVMQRLEPGSVILFGSKIDHGFVVDTVFVVASRIEYGRDEVDDLDAPEHVKDLALRPLYGEPQCHLRFVLYTGATVAHPVNGRWSFVPALPVADQSARFARPRVELPGLVNHALMMGLRSVATDDPALTKAWGTVLRTVHDAGLVAATHLQAPATTEPSGLDDPPPVSQPAVAGTARLQSVND